MTGRRRITVTIDRLLLNGHGPADAETLRRAMTAEIERQLVGGVAPSQSCSFGTVAADLPAASNAAATGKSAGARITRMLTTDGAGRKGK